MKTFHSRFAPLLAALVLGCALLACGGPELKPEHQALVDKYEQLIESYETKFAAVRHDQRSKRVKPRWQANDNEGHKPHNR